MVRQTVLPAKLETLCNLRDLVDLKSTTNSERKINLVDRRAELQRRLSQVRSFKQLYEAVPTFDFIVASLVIMVMF